MHGLNKGLEWHCLRFRPGRDIVAEMCRVKREGFLRCVLALEGSVHCPCSTPRHDSNRSEEQEHDNASNNPGDREMVKELRHLAPPSSLTIARPIMRVIGMAR